MRWALTPKQISVICAVKDREEVRQLLRVAFNVPGRQQHSDLLLLTVPGLDSDVYTILLDYYYYTLDFCKSSGMTPEQICTFMVRA